jgi:spoIIIJ-associated protein
VDAKKYSVASAGDRIRRFLDTVVERGHFRLKYIVEDGEDRHTDFENPDIVVKFSGPDVELLLENKGDLLLSLEQLTMEVLRISPEDHSRLCFDANDYRLLRIEELRMSALTAAERVKKTKQPFHFNPMNSRERRVIHLALRNETAVRSESLGVGPFRQVVIYPEGMPSLPAPPPPPPPPPGGYRGPGGGDRDRDRGPRREGGGPPRRGGDRDRGGRPPRRDGSGPPRRRPD